MTDPWDDWYIYRSMNGVNVGKYTVRPMGSSGVTAKKLSIPWDIP